MLNCTQENKERLISLSEKSVIKETELAKKRQQDRYREGVTHIVELPYCKGANYAIKIKSKTFGLPDNPKSLTLDYWKMFDDKIFDASKPVVYRHNEKIAEGEWFAEDLDASIAYGKLLAIENMSDYDLTKTDYKAFVNDANITAFVDKYKNGNMYPRFYGNDKDIACMFDVLMRKIDSHYQETQILNNSQKLVYFKKADYEIRLERQETKDEKLYRAYITRNGKEFISSDWYKDSPQIALAMGKINTVKNMPLEDMIDADFEEFSKDCSFNVKSLSVKDFIRFVELKTDALIHLRNFSNEKSWYWQRFREAQQLEKLKKSISNGETKISANFFIETLAATGKTIDDVGLYFSDLQKKLRELIKQPKIRNLFGKNSHEINEMAVKGTFSSPSR